MNIFNVISLLGGLAMFLYGMRLMGDSLKQNSSGTLKAAMEKVTDLNQLLPLPHLSPDIRLAHYSGLCSKLLPQRGFSSPSYLSMC